MTCTQALLLLLVMGFLAALPGLSTLLVAMESASGGLRRGAGLVAGVVVGDLAWILVAALGLQVLYQNVISRIDGIGYAASAILAWFAWRQWQAGTSGAERLQDLPESKPGSAFLRGLIVTLADQKALLFYLAFLPAFIDLDRPEPADLAVLTLVALLAVGGAKLTWAWLGARAGAILSGRWHGYMNRLAAVFLLGICCWLVWREAAF